MKNIKINVDRPQLNANEIGAGKDFHSIMSNHKFMSKPFYKQNWFYGTTGLASLGLIIGGTLAFQNASTENQVSTDMLNTEAPPNLTVPDNNLIVFTTKLLHTKDEVKNKTKFINLENITPLEENFTQHESTKSEILNLNLNQASDLAEITDDLEVTEVISEEKTEAPMGFGLDVSPRISNKLGGSITRNELLDNKGITTEGDISIIHFELHLIDGLGGKVFAEESNQLNQDMKDALENVGQGETIYFENIRGKVKSGVEVRLNPLRYVLMN